MVGLIPSKGWYDSGHEALDHRHARRTNHAARACRGPAHVLRGARAGGRPTPRPAPGFAATGGLWQPYFEAFGARYRLLVPDGRGHGRTANPGGLAAMNHRQFARDLIAFCRALGVERAAFCGASSGAMLLLTLGLEAPDLVAALVLAGGTYYFSKELRAILAGMTPEAFLRQAQPGAAAGGHAAPGPEGWRTVAESFGALGGHAHGEDFPEQEELRSIAAPTLIVHGDRDPLFPIAVPTALYGSSPMPNSASCRIPATPQWRGAPSGSPPSLWTSYSGARSTSGQRSSAATKSSGRLSQLRPNFLFVTLVTCQKNPVRRGG